MITSWKTKSTAAALALCALAQPQIAMAEECVEQADLSATVVYAMPLLGDAVNEKCSKELSPTGFMATKSEAFLAPYRAKQDANWPGAFRLLKMFSKKGKAPSGMGDMIDSLPESALRPFVDAVIVTMVGKEIKPADCGKIERGIALIAPLPEENVGDLAAFIFDMAEVKNPNLCPYRGDQ
ncbi:MAG: hypothetical protein ABJ242_09670 [Marinomonas sp.]